MINLEPSLGSGTVINQYLEILEDAGGKLTFEQVLEAEGFKARGTRDLNLGYTNSAIWVRFDLSNPLDEPTAWLLEQEFWNINWIDLYKQNLHGGWKHIKTGNLTPFKTREYPYQGFIFPLDFSAKETKTIYVRLQTDQVFEFKFELWNPTQFSGKHQAQALVLGHYFGLMWLMAIYSFFIYRSLNDRSYLFYFIFLVSLSMMQLSEQGMVFQYLIPEFPRLHYYSAPFWVAAMTTSGLFFAREYLHTKNHAPFWNFVLFFGGIASGFTLFSALVIPYWLNDYILASVAAFALVALIGSSIGAMVNGFKPARFFLGAWLFFIIGAVLAIARGLLLLPGNFFTLHGLQIGSAILVVLLSVGLANRIKQIQQKKVEAEMKGEEDGRFRATMDSSTDAIITSNAQGVILTWNRGAEIIFGFSALEAIDQSLTLILPPQYLEEILQGMRDYSQNKGGQFLEGAKEIKGHDKSGEDLPIEVAMNAWVTGGTFFFSCVIRDIRRRKELEKEATIYAAAIRDLLDNAGQGFFSFTEDLKIHKDFSAACIELFGLGFESQSATNLLFPSDENGENKSLVDMIFSGNIDSDVALSLLPNELDVLQKVVSLEYFFIEKKHELLESRIMVAATDITIEKMLTRDLEGSQKTRELVSNVVMNQEYFFQFVHDLLDLLLKVEGKATLAQGPEDFNGLMPIFHTIKGNSAIFSLELIQTKAHETESEISASPFVTGESSDPQSLKDKIKAAATTIRGDLMDYLDLLSDFIPVEDWDNVGSRSYHVSEEKIANLEAVVLSGKGENSLKTVVQKLRLQPIAPIFRVLAQEAQRLASHLGKQTQVEMAGEKTEVDLNRLKPILDSLVHIIRNSLDHGLEPALERETKGKNAMGKLALEADIKADHLQIEIYDDGAGIDPVQIESIAREKGLITNDTPPLQPHEACQLIFLPGFSSAHSVTELSGRGVGISTVKDEVENLGGTIELFSKLGQGTRFLIKLPLFD
ncbi:MAG: 7TM diverse intracellular signaling domain-containing protein [SAR324 cluster bacterium]|nr:7TM diverse intracellular signaling domain-containing protein [SAR324 cluster bacterium]